MTPASFPSYCPYLIPLFIKETSTQVLKSISLFSLSLRPSFKNKRAGSAALLFYFLALLSMAFLTFLPVETLESKKQSSKCRRKQKKKQPSSSSWKQIKTLLSCKQIMGSITVEKNTAAAGYSNLGYSCSSICSFRDVVRGNTRVIHRPDNSPESSTVGLETGLLSRKAVNGSSSSRSLLITSARSSDGGTYSTSSSRGIQLKKLSGCYECHMIVDPTRYPIPRTISACSECGEVFPKIDSLELHQAVRHAVSELGPEDSGRNIVEIIFKSSWLNKANPICNIERILKVHNTKRTIQLFENCRDAIKIRANTNPKKNPRCAADGNELLRFHCTTLTCSLGARGGSSLCGSVPGCGVCTIIQHGFQGNNKSGGGSKGVRTTASSGMAHESLGGTDQHSRAILVCRVIAGKVRRPADETAAAAEDSLSVGGALSSYDCVAGCTGIYSNLEELYVFNPRAILPCFVVIYKTLQT